MRKAILILIVLLLTVFVAAQSPKRRPTNTKALPTVSPCGIPIPTAAEFIEESKIEWRDIGENAKTAWYYNTQNQVCDKGILKVWTKSVQKNTTEPLAYSIDRLELNCRSNQHRLLSTVKYQKDGTVIDSLSVRDPKWEDVIPDSVGESILQTMCRKAP